LKGDKDIASIARTGMGKTLTFWMPLLFRPPGSVQIIVTPLNILGKQNVSALAKAGFKAVFISADTATAENFHVSFVVLMHKRRTY
jgi:superfamily II DNA helicase RecQ